MENKFISVIQTDNPQYVNVLLKGMSDLFLRRNKTSIIIDMRSVKSDVFWSVYGRENIKYADDMLNVISNINIQMLRTYVDLKNEILCVRNADNVFNDKKLDYLFECFSSIYENVVVVIQKKYLETKKDILNVSDVLILPFVNDPSSVQNCEDLYLEILSEIQKDVSIFPVMFDLGLNFDFAAGNVTLKRLSVLPFYLQFQHELLNTKFLFNDMSNKFVQALCDLITKISQCGASSKFINNDTFYERQTGYNALKDKMHKDLIEKMKVYSDEKDQNKLREIIKIQAENLFKIYNIELQVLKKRKLIKEVSDDIVGLSVLEDLVNDPEITEIMVNGCENIYVEKRGKVQKTDVKFQDEIKLKTVIDRIASNIGRHIDEASPIVDARLKDGSRVNAIIPPVALNGPVLTIRKFSKHKLSADDIVSYGSASVEMINFLKTAVKNKKNILISGGTGTGKTTLLNVISSFISEDERIITIEDSAELQLQQKHVIKLETRTKSVEGVSEITIRQLVVNALRMRPDRIIVGECRSGETLDMLQAMNTGHDGSMTTVHSNSCQDAFSRLLVMVLMSGVELPEKSIVSMIASAINVIVQIKRFADGSRKISEISVINKSDDKIYEIMPVFKYDAMTNIFKYYGDI